jgi:hypothetical protein
MAARQRHGAAFLFSHSYRVDIKHPLHPVRMCAWSARVPACSARHSPSAEEYVCDLHEDAHAGQTAASGKSSTSAEAPGQRLLKWLTWGVIAVLLVYGLVLTTAHVLARIVGMPRAQIVLAHLYTGEILVAPDGQSLRKRAFSRGCYRR